jgi:hypothetical protein
MNFSNSLLGCVLSLVSVCPEEYSHTTQDEHGLPDMLR